MLGRFTVLTEFGEQTKAYEKGNLSPKGLYWLAKSHFGLDNFKEALPVLLGEDAAGLSASTITRLTNEWNKEYEAFRGGRSEPSSKPISHSSMGR